MLAALWWAPAAVAADPISNAVAALRQPSLYVDPGAKAYGVKLDAVNLPADVKIAVLPDDGSLAINDAADIGSQLGASASNPLTVGVFTVTADGHGSFRAAVVEVLRRVRRRAGPGGRGGQQGGPAQRPEPHLHADRLRQPAQERSRRYGRIQLLGERLRVR